MDKLEDCYTSADDANTTEGETDWDSEEAISLLTADSVCNNYQATTETREATHECSQPQVLQSENSSNDKDKSSFLLQKYTSVYKEDQANLPTNKHFANIAFYVIDDKTKIIYGITNRHVTIHADETHVKMLNENTTRLLGAPIVREKTSHADIDVDLIKIDYSIGNHVLNTENQSQQVSIYDEPFDSIYGKEVSKYKPKDRLFEVSSLDTPSTGLIASVAEHKDFFGSPRQENGQFLVKSKSGAFSVEGESGTALAIQTTNRDVFKLVGIICGGSGRYTVCQFVPTMFRYLDDRHGTELQLYDYDYSKTRRVKNTDSSLISKVSRQADEAIAMPCVPFGIKIFFICSTPEQIAPLNFNLVEHALTLLCLDYGNFDIKKYNGLIEKENMLSLLVSNRASLHNCSVFENDKPDYVAVEKGMLACDYLYKGRAKEAESCLKEAITCVIKIDNLGLRMLCKLTTYITWFCLASNTTAHLKQLKTLLDDGIEIFENDFKTLTGFPKEALGYMYFDFSRYYMCKYDILRRRRERNFKAETKTRQHAVKKAKYSLEVFQQDFENKNCKETQRRLVLAKCQLAYVLLGCGHEFNVISGEVSIDEITQAKDIINNLKLDVANTPLVQNVDYLIALVDLNYRRGLIKEAFETAKACLSITRCEVKNYFIGYHRAKCRLEKLERLLDLQ